MTRTKFNRVATAGAFMFALCPSVAAAQPAPVPYHTVPFVEDTGSFRGAVGPEAESFTAFRQEVRVPGAPWVQLRFGDHNLGSESYLTVTSLKDGASQRLNSLSLSQWQNSTALFNGDAVKVELHVAPGEEGIFFRIEEVIAGETVSSRERNGALEAADEEGEAEAICGNQDGRTASADARVGRIVPVGCTGWIVSNGAHLTAGHCTGAQMQMLQFNVPASQSDGTINNPPPQDQYAIAANSVEFADDGDGEKGQDWAVFDVAPNANTGRLPVHVQGAFFRTSRDTLPSGVHITGHGVDGPAPNFGTPPPTPPPRNADNQTQQTHTGHRQGQGDIGSGSDVHWEYKVDTQQGNSGSPIIALDTDVTVGIHTNGGCSQSGGANVGTSFENDSLETTLRNFSGVGANVRHLDIGHTLAHPLDDGTVFRPFDTLAEAVNSVPAGGVVSIVAGEYGGAITINKPMELRAPVGSVTLSGAP